MKNVVKQSRLGNWKLVVKVADYNGSISIDSAFKGGDALTLAAKGLSAWGMLAIVRTACDLIGAPETVKELCKAALVEAQVYGCNDNGWGEQIDEIQ